jgi:hypothetical protein
MEQYQTRIEDYARDQLILISPNQTSTAVATAPTNPVDNTRTISITVNYDFSFLLPYIGAATGPIQMSANSTGFLAEN